MIYLSEKSLENLIEAKPVKKGVLKSKVGTIDINIVIIDNQLKKLIKLLIFFDLMMLKCN